MTQAVKNTFKTPKTPLKRTKTEVPDTQNALLAQAPEIPPMNDRERLKLVANLLLDHLENIARQHKARSQESEKTREEKWKLLFGEKNSCMDNLVELTDLLLKLEQPTVAPALENPMHNPELAMNAADMALVDNFVSRVRGREREEGI